MNDSCIRRLKVIWGGMRDDAADGLAHDSPGAAAGIPWHGRVRRSMLSSEASRICAVATNILKGGGGPNQIYLGECVLDWEASVVLKHDIVFTDHNHRPSSGIQVGELPVLVMLHWERSVHILDGRALRQNHLQVQLFKTERSPAQMVRHILWQDIVLAKDGCYSE